MERENNKRTARNTTEATTATYVEAAQQGKNQWWRYLVGLVVILVAWLVAGSVASVGVAFLLSGQPDHTALSPIALFVYFLAGFPFFLAGILLVVSLIHRRHPRTLITTRNSKTTGSTRQPTRRSSSTTRGLNSPWTTRPMTHRHLATLHRGWSPIGQCTRSSRLSAPRASRYRRGTADPNPTLGRAVQHDPTPTIPTRRNSMFATTYIRSSLFIGVLLLVLGACGQPVATQPTTATQLTATTQTPAAGAFPEGMERLYTVSKPSPPTI